MMQWLSSKTTMPNLWFFIWLCVLVEVSCQAPCMCVGFMPHLVLEMARHIVRYDHHSTKEGVLLGENGLNTQMRQKCEGSLGAQRAAAIVEMQHGGGIPTHRVQKSRCATSTTPAGRGGEATAAVAGSVGYTHTSFHVRRSELGHTTSTGKSPGKQDARVMACSVCSRLAIQCSHGSVSVPPPGGSCLQTDRPCVPRWLGGGEEQPCPVPFHLLFKQ